jgi:hypothetical protein
LKVDAPEDGCGWEPQQSLGMALVERTAFMTSRLWLGLAFSVDLALR